MKHLVLLCILCAQFRLYAQQPLSYPQLLERTREIDLADSLLFDTSPAETSAIDSVTVKKWFGNLLPTGAANKFKNRSFSLIGKITGHHNFDLLLLLEEKTRKDSSGTQIVYLVSLKKQGDYIASLKAAVGGTKKRTAYNISSCLYSDFKIVQDSRITINDKAYNDMAWYKINSGGRFVSQPKME